VCATAGSTEVYVSAVSTMLEWSSIFGRDRRTQNLIVQMSGEDTQVRLRDRITGTYKLGTGMEEVVIEV
jgi:hypothetical protein